MQPLRRVHTPTQQDDEILDLESSGIYEMERPIHGPGIDEIWCVIRFDEPHPSPRCHSSEREILRSTFVDL